jgi:hypothetical protein
MCPHSRFHTANCNVSLAISNRLRAVGYRNMVSPKLPFILHKQKRILDKKLIEDFTEDFEVLN